MKRILFADALSHTDEIVAALAGGNLACLPIRGAYRIVANARSEATLHRLAQSKRRAHNRPALIMVSRLDDAHDIVDGGSWQTTKRLTKALWPGPLTVLLPPSDKLALPIKKLLTRSTGRIGIRTPDDPLMIAVLREFGGALVVSSANLENKPGARSAATVQTRFQRTVDVWVDAKDIAPELPSTLVDLSEDSWKIVRDGAVSHDAIARALG